MKKVVILVLVISFMMIIASGCNINLNESKINSIFKKNSEVMKIYYPRNIISTPDEAHVEKWEEYISGKYNLRIDLINLLLVENKPPKSESDAGGESKENPQRSGIDFDELVDLSGTSGFILVDHYKDLTELINRDLLMPVNFCIESIGSRVNIDTGMVEGFTDSKGDVWALPLVADDFGIAKRTYNKEWLDKAGMTVPETIEEFFEFAKYIANEDPDGNGIDDTYIADYTNMILFSAFEDVFKAFGCYSYLSSPIAYNPHNLQFEHAILGDNFIEAMSFIEAMKDANLIVNRDTSASDYKIASSYRGSMNYEYVKERAYGYFLRGLNESLLIEEIRSEKCLAVLKHTNKAAEKIEEFYDMIYSDRNSFMDFYFGIRDEDYFDMVDYYKVNHDIDPTVPSFKPLIGVYISLNRMEPLDKPILNTAYDISKAELNRHLQAAKEVKSAYEGAASYLGTSMVYRINFDIYDYEVSELYRYSGPTEELFSDILDNNSITIESAISKYWGHTGREDIVELLREINSR